MLIFFLLGLAVILTLLFMDSLKDKNEIKIIHNKEYYEEYLIEYAQVFKYKRLSDLVISSTHSLDPEDPAEVKITETNIQFNKTFKCKFYKEEERKAYEDSLFEQYGKPDYISSIEISNKYLIDAQLYPWSKLGTENIKTEFRSLGFSTELKFYRGDYKNCFYV